MKIIIWGYPLHSHTHSYVHASWVKAFKFLGYETYWFDDANYDKNILYENCLFITEGYADKNIPLHKSNIYFVHVGIKLDKYINVGAKVYDMRYNDYFINDCNYNYNLEDKIKNNTVTQIGLCTYFEPASNNDPIPKIYISWATDLLPHEFNENDMYLPTQNIMVFIGSISNSNQKEYNKLVQGCNDLGINVTHIDPWRHPVSFEINRQLIQKSIICPDIRGSGDPYKLACGDNGTDHKNNGYIPCRVFKHISYGKLGATNSKRVYELFGPDLIIYDDDEYILAKKTYENHNNFELIKRQMAYVKENHTFINRINDLLSIILL